MRKPLFAIALAMSGLGFFSTRDAAAFRTAEDSPEFAGAGVVAWSTPNVSFVLSRVGLPKTLSAPAVEEALQAALAAWAEPTCSAVRPTFDGWTDDPGAPRDAINTISWIDSWSDGGLPANAPGHTDIQYKKSHGTWTIQESDIYLNNEEFSWSTKDPQLNLQAVLTHEVGHALGLLHPCEPDGSDGAPVCGTGGRTESEATMFPLYDEGQETLASDDQAGICFLYPVPPAVTCDPECGAGAVCIDGQCRTTCKLETCTPGQVCGQLGCSPPDQCLKTDCRGDSCIGDTECFPFGRCMNSVCTIGNASWGESCQHSADCVNGTCIDGICQPRCEGLPGAPCGRSRSGVRGVCIESDDPPARGCVDSRQYSLGFTCQQGEDCDSGLCVIVGPDSACTETCSISTTCPLDWSCQQIDGRSVCAPQTLKSRGGCSLAPSAPPNTAGGSWLNLLFALPPALVFARRRNQRAPL